MMRQKDLRISLMIIVVSMVFLLNSVYAFFGFGETKKKTKAVISVQEREQAIPQKITKKKTNPALTLVQIDIAITQIQKATKSMHNAQELLRVISRARPQATTGLRVDAVNAKIFQNHQKTNMEQKI